MALTQQQRIRILAEQLASKQRVALTKTKVAALIGAMDATEFAVLREAIRSGARVRVGAVIIRLFEKEIRQKAVQEATAAWTDGSISPAEFDRAFE